jgi:tetratricopeptide (TPR) repeat protein
MESEHLVYPDLDTNTINKIEAWIQSELPLEIKDATWEVHMSGIFIQYEFGTEGLQRARSAANLDPSNWRTNLALAYAYALEGPDQDLTSAIENMALVAMKFRSDPVLALESPAVFCEEILANLGKWTADLKRYDTAMEFYDEMLERFPDRTQTIMDILQLLKQQDKASEIENYLRGLNTQINKDGLSRLISLYHEFSANNDLAFYDLVTSTLTETDSMIFVRETLQIAIEAATSDDKKRATAMYLRLWYARLLNHVAQCEDDRDEALRVWEENLTPRASDNDTRTPQLWTIIEIAPAYLDRARSLGFENPAAQMLMSRLKGLTETLDEIGIKDIFNINRLVGRGNSLMGETENARSSLRKDVHIALTLLSDNDESNDWQGYQALAVALIPLSDDENALAAYSLICPTTDIRDDSSSSDTVSNDKESETTAGAESVDLDSHITKLEDVNSQKTVGNLPESSPEDGAKISIKKGRGAHKISSCMPGDGPLIYSCDGCCGRTWSFPDDIYRCKDCRDVKLDTVCYQKLKDGSFKLPEGKCHASHDFLHVPAWDPEALQALPPASVKVGNRLLTIKEWLDGIKKDWGF